MTTPEHQQAEREAPCGDCGMPCFPNEYHPYAACLMFKACHNSDTVRANLKAVLDHGAGERAYVVPLSEEQLRDQIRQRLFATGTTQKDYAAQSGYSEQYLSDFLNGRRSPGWMIVHGEGLKEQKLYVAASQEPK